MPRTRDDLTGKIFGDLKVIKKGNKKGGSYWVCICSCGKEFEARASRLKPSQSRKCQKNCGCQKYKSNKKSPNWKGFGNISSTLWTRFKREAKKREISFEILIEDAWSLFEKQKSKCALSGVEIKFSKKAYDGEQTASLDRIDSSGNYSIDNVQWVHKTVNTMKWSLPEDVFIEWCKKIANLSCTKQCET